MGRSSFISCSPFSGRAKRQTGFALCLRFKSPKAASNLQFERPWDHLVPAKSVRKLTARVGVSKKFLGRSAQMHRENLTVVECAVLSAVTQVARQSAEDSGPLQHLPASADDVACLLSLASRDQTDNHRDDQQGDYADHDIEWF